LSNTFDAASWTGIKPSLRLLVCVAGVHGGALALCLVLAQGAVAKIGLAALLFVNAFRFFCVWSGQPAVVQRLSTGRWRLESVSGAAQEAELALPVFVTPWLVIACFHGRRRRRTLLLGPDSLPADSFRRLRAGLLQCAHGR
jgi:hypothetical protein